MIVGGNTEAIFIDDLTPNFLEDLIGLNLTWTLVDVADAFLRGIKSWTSDKAWVRDSAVSYEI